MQVSINGTSKEVVAFLVSLSGRYAAVTSAPAPVVMEVHETVRVAVKDALADAGTVVINGAAVKAAPEVTGAVAGDPPTENLSTQQLEDKLTPRAGEAVTPIDPPKTEEPKTRKRREKVSGESKLGTGAPSAGAEPTKTEPVADEKPTPPAQPTADAFGLPAEWPVMSVQARRNWISTAQHLAPSQRLELLHANPVPVAEPEPVKIAEPTKTEPNTEVTPAGDAAAECALPPTWQAWSLPKRIMWATMRSVTETNSLLKQFGFADKIPDATADTLFNVRRKLEIAMRMEAQS